MMRIVFSILTNVFFVCSKVDYVKLNPKCSEKVQHFQSTGGEDKALGVFKVVTFPNDGCNTTTSE